jgi:hypothetical protein
VSASGWVKEACDPYPAAPGTEEYGHYPDLRHARWVSEVLDRLDIDEARDLARTLATLYPRLFEQGLLYIQRNRDWRAGQ